MNLMSNEVFKLENSRIILVSLNFHSISLFWRKKNFIVETSKTSFKQKVEKLFFHQRKRIRKRRKIFIIHCVVFTIFTSTKEIRNLFCFENEIFLFMKSNFSYFVSLLLCFPLLKNTGIKITTQNKRTREANGANFPMSN